MYLRGSGTFVFAPVIDVSFARLQSRSVEAVRRDGLLDRRVVGRHVDVLVDRRQIERDLASEALRPSFQLVVPRVTRVYHILRQQVRRVLYVLVW